MTDVTPEQKLALLEATLRTIADIGDGDVQTLLRSNQFAADVLRQIKPPSKIRVVLEFEMKFSDGVDSVSDAHHEIIGYIKENIGEESELSEADMIKSIDIDGYPNNQDGV